MRTERYPLLLYGPRGWDDLNDCVRVWGADEEAEVRGRGYSVLGEEVVDWSRPWLTVLSDLRSRGFSGSKKADGIKWAAAKGLNTPE